MLSYHLHIFIVVRYPSKLHFSAVSPRAFIRRFVNRFYSWVLNDLRIWPRIVSNSFSHQDVGYHCIKKFINTYSNLFLKLLVNLLIVLLLRGTGASSSLSSSLQRIASMTLSVITLSSYVISWMRLYLTCKSDVELSSIRCSFPRF